MRDRTRRQSARRERRRTRRTPRPSSVQPPRDTRPGLFEVLCRIDAYADYVALVEADCAEEAALLASDDHGAYQWEHWGTVEFDARLYVTLDKDGAEIEASQVGDR